MIENIIVILAGGLGTRYDPQTPKQYTTLCGREIIQIVIEETLESKKADRIIVVLDQETRSDFYRQKYDADMILGGRDRAHSFQNALDFIYLNYPDSRNVIFHEAARPLITHEVFDKYFDLLTDYDYIESCRKITDSLGSYTVKAPSREDYYLIQAPEAYRISVLKEYFDCESDIYFAANQFPDSCKGYKYFEIKNNIKLTTPEDKMIIEYLMRLREQ